MKTKTNAEKKISFQMQKRSCGKKGKNNRCNGSINKIILRREPGFIKNV